VDAWIAVLIFSAFHTSVNIVKPRTLSWLRRPTAVTLRLLAAALGYMLSDVVVNKVIFSVDSSHEESKLHLSCYTLLAWVN